MTTVLVTGVSGLVGSHLAAVLWQRGHQVVGTASRPDVARTVTPGVERKIVLRLGDTPAGDVFRGVGAIVHCAHDLRPGQGAATVDGTRRIADAANGSGVRHQLFISSYSAHPAAVSEYGRAKLVLQEHFLARGAAVARLGLVVGPGGVFRRMFETAGEGRVVPLPDGGRMPVPVISAGDLAAALASIVEERLTGSFNLWSPERVTLAELVRCMRRQRGRRGMLVPVPSLALLGALWIAGLAGVRLPIDAGNVRGLRANRGLADRPDLVRFVAQPEKLREAVAGAVRTLLAQEVGGAAHVAGTIQ